MHIESNIKDLLIRSFDEELSTTDAARLEQALTQSSTLRTEFRKMENMRKSISTLRVKKDPGFADDVLARLKEEGKKTLNTVIASIFPKVAAACLVVFLLSLLAIYFSSGTLSVDAIIGVDELTPEDASIYLGYR